MSLNNTSFEFSLPINPLPERLQDYRLKKKYTDVIIKVGEEEYPAHKMVLEDSSPVFKAMFSENWIQNDVYEFNQEFVDSEIVGDLLSFFYTAKLTITTENAYSVCVASHYLDIPALVSASEKFLSEKLTTENVLGLLQLSHKINLETLQKKCSALILDKSNIVLKDIKLMSFTLEDLQFLIRDVNQMNKKTNIKEVIFETIISWVENDLSGRLNSLPTLLRSIPLSELSIQFLGETVATHSMIMDSPVCSRLLNEAFSKAVLDSQKPITKSNNLNSSSSKLYCLGGRNVNGKYLSSGSYLNVSTGKWDGVTSMSIVRAYFSGAVIGSKIYVLGGWNDISFKIMEVYDCEMNTWTQLADMPQVRSHFGAAALNGFIYAAGGVIFVDTSSVVRYSVETNKWQTVKSMQNNRHSHQLIELNGRLFAICGFNTNTVEEYNPNTDQWTFVASTQYKHSSFGATSHEGKIYVCSDLGFEVYSPESNTWETLTPLNNNCERTLVSINGKLWAMGGGKSWKGTKSVHEYDTTSGQWKQLPDMDVERSGHCSFAVKT